MKQKKKVKNTPLLKRTINASLSNSHCQIDNTPSVDKNELIEL